MRKIGIYIHIPFCVKKCNYCDFNSGPYSVEIQQKYVDSLCKEMIAKSQFFSCYQVDTVFIGGGTPSILVAHLIGKIFDTLNKYYRVSNDAEISIECNPGTCNEDKLKQYLSLGINRISFGLQSTNNDQLAVLGRIHRYEDFLKSYNDARSAGFTNINVDLMGAIPNQNLESFKEGLLKIKGIGPEHLSIYSLIIEEGTPFYNMNLNLADEDEEREMVHIIPSTLGDEYHQYEISNYAKKGYECKHNIKYWKRDEYVGFGVSAASLLSFDYTNSVDYDSFANEPCFRYKNIANVNDYISFDGDILKLNDERECLEQSDIESEYIFLGLRMNEGIFLPDYTKRFNKNIFDEYNNAVNKHIENGLLIREGDRLYLSERGRDLSNYVFKDFV
ncbi:MAG: radical SAM family heme chaperone HemW [Lachnospiraceae bacterium]|nr:radical SAM family heme chaperone HemW [Lachnospiraceae bacterium]